MGRFHPDLRLIVQIGEAAPRIKLDDRIFGNLPTIRAIEVAWGRDRFMDILVRKLRFWEGAQKRLLMIPRAISAGSGTRINSFTEVIQLQLLVLFLTSQTQPVFWR
ncbi:hypothetical protein QT970_25185 [Microcoleus sp. herbarium8]|uniref:hypothetical protein n=1 Tax=Microcoleus sp. herbarium8 TaxID=3055436 RepID=UPI002FCF1694